MTMWSIMSPEPTEGSIAQLDAAPNSGPATLLGNAEVKEGPPSVS